MIHRYTRPAMGAIWTDENKYRTWLKVEVLACEAMAAIGRIPPEAAAVIRAKADFSVERIDAIEKETKHDVIAFLTSVAEFVGPEARYIHLGLTSSDVLDTSLACLLKEAGELILADIDALLAAIAKRAHEHKETVMIGRSHGIHAEPITFGLKLAVWYDEMRRGRNVRQHSAGSRNARLPTARASAGPRLDTGRAARPACGIFHDAGARRRLYGKNVYRN